MSYTFKRGDEGCYLDGTYGWLNTYRVIELAQAHGWKLSDAYRVAVNLFGASDDIWELVAGQGGLADSATDYLQGITEPGLYWEWDMGELCLVVDDNE